LSTQLELSLPDRFEGLRLKAADQLSSIIEPVHDGLARIDDAYEDMQAAARGAFVLLKGGSGTGKSTFLHTVHMFRQGVETLSIGPSHELRATLQSLSTSHARLCILVLEDREALKDVEVQEIERDLHAVNGFIRSAAGRNCLVVWPCNTDELERQILSLANAIGGDALLGTNHSSYLFGGPDRRQFRKIADTTVAVLNQGATLAGLGISEDEIEKLIKSSETVGKLLGGLRQAIRAKRESVTKLLRTEQCKLWIVVAAGNEPNGEVAALTRGSYSAVDIERLLTATDANVVRELKLFPSKLGILGTVLDAKVFHLPMLAALDIARTYADEDLRRRMKQANLSDTANSSTKALHRLANTDLGRAFVAGPQGPLSPGSKPGSNTEEAFRKLVSIAQRSDVSVNRAIGAALSAAGYVQTFATERDLGLGLTRRTDLYCEATGNIVRMEIMWRAKTSRAEIANYVLTKLHNYGRAIGFLTS
jgi:DNA (cytosine-5)-methyltransferase 1